MIDAATSKASDEGVKEVEALKAKGEEQKKVLMDKVHDRIDVCVGKVIAHLKG